uniref:Uncharacterized protein n=1 Tax=Panagrolaimus sp. PS1159 TaxID=55785 RepID=A0AC35G8U2_9BILA
MAAAAAETTTTALSFNSSITAEIEEYSEDSPPKSIRELKFINNVVADTLSIIFNILMLFIINTQAKNQLKQYRKVLLMNTIVDLIYSIHTILFQPTVFVVDGYFFMVMEGFFQYWPQPFTTIFCHTHLFMLYVTLTVVPVQFVYRYLLICRNIELNNFNFLVLVGIAIFVSGSYAGTWLFNFWPKTSDKILEKYLDNSKWWLSSDKHIPPFAVAFYDDMSYVAPFSAIIMLVIYKNKK